MNVGVADPHAMSSVVANRAILFSCICVSHRDSIVGGGRKNKAEGAMSDVGGGELNIAAGEFSYSGGGVCNAANGNFAVTIGSGAKADSASSIVLNAKPSTRTVSNGADCTASDYTCTDNGAETVSICAPNGLFLNGVEVQAAGAKGEDGKDSDVAGPKGETGKDSELRTRAGNQCKARFAL